MITSNRESGFGRYDVMLTSTDKEKDLAETVANALNQIEEKQYEAELPSAGFVPEQIRKYGFAFKGKKCLIG